MQHTGIGACAWTVVVTEVEERRIVVTMVRIERGCPVREGKGCRCDCCSVALEEVCPHIVSIRLRADREREEEGGRGLREVGNGGEGGVVKRKTEGKESGRGKAKGWKEEKRKEKDGRTGIKEKERIAMDEIKS